MGSNLEIKYNNLLTSLDALENIEADSIVDLSIFNNPILNDCDAESICHYLNNLTGTVNIYNNLAGCDRPQDIAENCGIILPCLPYGNYYLLTQTDIDNFLLEFPDCNDLQGNVTVKGGGISNLNGLDSVTSIGGNFIVENTTQLNSFTGVENLTSIGLSLVIWSNDGLTNLSGLEGLHNIGDGLHLWNNNYLTNLTGLEQLTHIGGPLQIIHNASLTMMTGLENLDSIGDHVNITDNVSLTSLSGLNNIIIIEGGLALADDPNLSNLIDLRYNNSINLMEPNHNIIS